MTETPDIQSKERKRQKRERLIILITLVLIIGLAFLGIKVLHLSPSKVLGGNILLFALININLILILLLIFLVLRNVVKLIFERRHNILGAKLRTRLVVAFVLFALLPTTFLFFISLQFINTSIDYWFNVRVEKSLEDSLEVGRTFYKQVEKNVITHADRMSREITRSGLMSEAARGELSRYLRARPEEFHLDTMEVILPSYEELAGYRRPGVGMFEPAQIPSKTLRRCLNGEKGIVDTFASTDGDLVRGFDPIFSSADGDDVVGVLAVGIFVPAGLTYKMKNIAGGIENYKQLKLLKNPIKVSLIIILLIISLIIVFSATWFGFYLARGITVPIQHLAEGTRRIAGGDLDFTIDVRSEDEIGTLVESFNKMTADLKRSHSELERAGEELQKSYLELEQRRRYTEIILRNVAAGVVSIDNDGRISTMNKFAEELFGVRPGDVIGKTYQELATPGQLAIIHALVEEARRAKKGSVQKSIRITAGDRSLSLLVNATVLKDDAGNNVGMVIVFDDLTQLEKAQRMAAWREVARRIAHEVKNPLTPIQLSAQRLRKRYIEKLADDSKVFDDCTRTIINQVEELKRLVNEFSLFARLPATSPALNNLEGVVEESITLYRDSHKDIDFVTRVHQPIPQFYFDREQIKRAMINLFDNDIAAMEDHGKIEVELFYDSSTPPMVRIEVSDTGKGIAPEDRDRLFEPYFSTKKGGTGLGLTIVSTIISDHNGYIRVQDNEPKGARFVIELPLRG
jgi:two-component system nitrogen regulation sensor histidine kinase NtrY